MNSSKLQNRFFKTRTEESKKPFNCQINFYVSLLYKTRRCFFWETGPIELSLTIKNFWRIFSPLFSKRAFQKESIVLNNNNKTISNNEELSEIQ